MNHNTVIGALTATFLLITGSGCGVGGVFHDQPLDTALPLPQNTTATPDIGHSADVNPAQSDPAIAHTLEWAYPVISEVWNPTSEIAIDLNTITDTLAITAPGNYRLTGDLRAPSVVGLAQVPGPNPNIVVNVADPGLVRLILENVTVQSGYDIGPALNIRQAEKVAIMLPEGSRNELKSSQHYPNGDADTPEFTLYSPSDLVIYGGGQLSVWASIGRIQVGVDGDLVIDQAIVYPAATKVGGNYVQLGGEYNTVGELNVGEQVAVLGGLLAISAGRAAIVTAGVTIADGEVYIDSADDGIVSSGTIHQTGGVVNVQTQDSRLFSPLRAEGGIILDGGTLYALGSADAITDPSEASTQSWLRAHFMPKAVVGSEITIRGANFVEGHSVRTDLGASGFLFSSPELVSGAVHYVYYPALGDRRMQIVAD